MIFQCIPLSKVGDNVQDCVDKTDEQGTQMSCCFMAKSVIWLELIRISTVIKCSPTHVIIAAVITIRMFVSDSGVVPTGTMSPRGRLGFYWLKIVTVT